MKFRRGCLISPGAGLSLVMLILLQRPAHTSAQTDDPAASRVLQDGVWTAVINSEGPIVAPDVSGTVVYSGDARFEINSGIIVEGSWQMEGISTYSGSNMSAAAVILYAGVMEGTNEAPVLRQTARSGTASGTIGGAPFGGAVPMEGPMFTARVTLILVSCNDAVGKFPIPLNEAAAMGGASSDLIAPFYATREGSVIGAADPYHQAVIELRMQAERFMDIVAGGEYSEEGLDRLIQNAETLWRSLRACHTHTPTGHFQSLVADIISDVIEFALANPDLFSTSDLHELILAGHRTGALGDGAADPDRARSLEGDLNSELNRRLSEENTCGNLRLILASVISLGDNGLITSATEAVTAACGGS